VINEWREFKANHQISRQSEGEENKKMKKTIYIMIALAMVIALFVFGH